jgi:hypothetical protein
MKASRISLATVLASVVVFFSFGGAGFAASRLLITSSSQIAAPGRAGSIEVEGARHASEQAAEVSLMAQLLADLREAVE